MSKSIVIVGAGVAGVNAATKLIDNDFDGQITIIDMGKNPYERPYEDVMTGFLGAGGWSDGSLLLASWGSRSSSPIASMKYVCCVPL